MRFLKLLCLLVFIVLIGAVFKFFSIPLAYLFASIIGTLLFIRIIDNDIYFPKPFANSGVFVMGIQIGTSFTLPAIIKMTDDWYNIVIITILTLMLALLLSIPFRYLTNSTVETAVLASVPGALSQMIIMAEENKNADLLLVSLTQTSRIVFIVILVPMITHFSKSSSVSKITEVPNLSEVFSVYMLLIPIAGYVMYRLLRRIKFPAAILLGPMVPTIVWNLITEAPFTLDFVLIAFAQILFGIRIGMQITTLFSQLSLRDICAIVIQNIGLIVGSMLLVIIYTMFTSHEFTSLFLSAAPGGLAQIIVVAMESGGDIAMISSYHLFRIFFIILIVVPIVHYLLMRPRAQKS